MNSASHLNCELNRHFYWWTRIGFIDTGGNSEAKENTKFEYRNAKHI